MQDKIVVISNTFSINSWVKKITGNNDNVINTFCAFQRDIKGGSNYFTLLRTPVLIKTEIWLTQRYML